MEELARLDATALAQLVHKKEVKPIELVEAAIARAEKVNGTLNAIVTPMYEIARDLAKNLGSRIGKADPPGAASQSRLASANGPFTGVPFLLKDLMGMYEGVRMTGGSRVLKDFVAKHHSELTIRFLRAGLIPIGRTNTQELGILPTTESVLLGPAKNPWNIAHSTGGSSGGSAAAVAAGIVPMAHANDGGGSIRIPASCCGLFGLKPTRGRNPLGPDLGDVMNGLVVEHCVSRSVRDSARLLDATHGMDIGAPYDAPPRLRPYENELGADPKKMRIAFTTVSHTGTLIDPECVAAVEKTAKLCAELGHEVVEAHPGLDGAQISQAFLSVWMAGTAAELDTIALENDKVITEADVEPLTWAAAELGRGVSAAQYLVAIHQLQKVGRVLGHFLEKYDFWLTPTLAEPPLQLGVLKEPEGMPLAPLMRSAEYLPFTPIANFSGVPAMNVPLYWSTGGLPTGSHFFAKMGGEDKLFALAAQLERALPWAGRRPPVSAI
jgi:amidase